MLHQFLDTQRAELIRRCRIRSAGRHAPSATPPALDHGIPLFMDQLIRALRIAQHSGARARPLRVVGDDPATDTSEIAATAMQHGQELSQLGVPIDQAVHAYGDLCQVVTELACETGTPIAVDEFRTLNRCLDDAIAGAVTEFSYQRDAMLEDDNGRAEDGRLRGLLQELQAHVQAATLALGAVEAGNVGMKGATGAILGLSLVSLRTLIERGLAGTRDGTRDGARDGARTASRH